MKPILLVDDKEENLYYLQSLLQGHGYTVQLARHGAEALSIARQGPPELVVSDLLMPIMDGYTLLRHWRADPLLRHTPFLVYTATYTQPEDEELALGLGADAFILKPAEPEEFLARIRTAITEGARKDLPPPKQDHEESNGLMKTYSETLIRKLEEKTLQLEESNKRLERDIFERKQLERQFLRMQRLDSIGTLAGGIAHDLNNLLSPIVMGVDLLRHRATDESSIAILENISQSARRGSDLVRQILSFARGIEGSKVTIQVNGLLLEVQGIITKTFPKNIRLEITLPAEIWNVVGDPTQLHQVILNLCVNSRDAMPEGGVLTIKAGNCELDEQFTSMNRSITPGRYVIIEVADEGHGMTTEVMERAFEPFFTTKELGKGTGLGLSTAVGIVRSHGGFVHVYSEPGKGSSFKIYLPVRENMDEPATIHTPPKSMPCGNGELILIVDDEESILTITKSTLEAFGYQVLTACDGAHAVSIYAGHRDEIALVLTDMMMPVMDGLALIAALHHFTPDLRIIAASGLESNGNVAKAGSAGVRHFLPKPYTAEKLLSIIHTVLNEPSTHPAASPATD